MITIFKFVHGKRMGYLSGMFEFNDKARGREHQFRLVIKQSRLGITKPGVTQRCQMLTAEKILRYLEKYPYP